MPQEIILKGRLWKRGGFRGGRKSWKLRFFVLSPTDLSYYRTSKPVLLGKINFRAPASQGTLVATGTAAAAAAAAVVVVVGGGGGEGHPLLCGV